MSCNNPMEKGGGEECPWPTLEKLPLQKGDGNNNKGVVSLGM